MTLERRSFLAGAAALSVAAPAAAAAPAGPMYGMVGKMTAKPGMRDALAAILVEGTAAMPGCLSYVVANDASDADLLWITEVWESKAAHAGSLALPAVRAAIAKGRPMIAAMETVAETAPVGGAGLR
ncbi:antibiotic biosynthesis monooxygenase [Sphingomonas sp. ABOLE]|uniref:putative quinol monooxygenase n=1 Tax=Sphingomonas sp. ABOLE TaxID=1985878 RepID=UPI000F7F3E84|nr:putative quinol monooxygenase [Sphingomonas sp. ABOLE]RSV44324.1 antibiotic biosynthesis monooxygenase [Sphingomonas sp. ABOLE]